MGCVNKLSELKPDTFRREFVLMSRENFTYLGIEEGPQSCLVLAWSKETKQTDRHMLTARALQCLVGSKQVPDYRVAADPSRNFGFILCPDEDKAERLRGHYVKVGDDKIFYDIVSSVAYMPYLNDVNQHPRVSKMI
ncbi:hypothetical protein PVAP13_9KG325500 [Panicum virgatum]|uniref:Uncharacterized protein n=1 Tax=Panicum virgatum TaxID=38727 RepID=A0A8T0NV68_PANVG|nr:hypothetical protein PVAP13_9KG325500 [Panicum virgatum]KAG2550625.1 hypothetical protein PVAP13_9KG325500 [Panicum virgatum]